MFETAMTVVGNCITEPVMRPTSAGDVTSFRMASNSRRRDSETGDWANDKTLYLTVSCWRKLAMGVAASVEKGRPIIVTGHVHTSEYVGADGQMRTSLEMTATSVGLDLARCIARTVGFPATPASAESPAEVEAESTPAIEGGGGDGVVPAVIITDVDDEINGIAPRDDELSPTF
ncbi:MAG TPA: single-stranded DNA-binding protein [Gordonia sp. (in: high G+C Gram-positive bacteria)]|uniref:single-stranded DNA-binding protein n=2 Tax=Gordonia TaxID=2053 RepID=UPI000FBBC940|nr:MULTISPECIES: single-stranded DNA-binding protein [unclassified Gordonia (in: high G+C Gram-positive bacteria)]RUP37871.1 MAG: single-stranded DNA-binding protein [Gordonia sp. (in: high G+C Gram-positive bacteria)]HRC51375.1 single-stranded DNA-binding protein [Gordonia sp. (in: high G+C Gram-positive bacteria)]